MLTTTVFERGKAQFDMTGKLLGYNLKELPETISAGLAKRLTRYAEGRLEDAGFLQAVQGWEIEVSTMDGDEQPANRSYCVEFKNAQGGRISVVGILTRHGWPTLDHGFEIGER